MPGILERAGWDGHSQALEQREVDVDVEQFGLKAGHAIRRRHQFPA